MMDKVEYAQCVRGVMFDLLGHLTTLEEPVTFSAKHDAAPAVDALRDFMKKRGVPDGEVDFSWNEGMGDEETKPRPKLKVVKKSSTLVGMNGKPLT